MPHEGLLAKLRGYGFHGKLMKILEALYQCPRASVRVGSHRSDPFDYMIGVRQGCPASPILFNLYINDVLDGLSGVRVGDMTIPGLLFADDAVVLAESSQALQEDLVRIIKWCRQLKISLNISSI